MVISPTRAAAIASTREKACRLRLSGAGKEIAWRDLVHTSRRLTIRYVRHPPRQALREVIATQFAEVTATYAQIRRGLPDCPKDGVQNR